MKPILQAALALAELGLPVFPLMEDHEHPLARNSVGNATTNPQDIYATFNRHRHNLGVATGIGSGVMVLEEDRGEGFADSPPLAELEEQHGKLPATWCSCHILTGRIFHWFRLPPGHAVPSGPIACGLIVHGDAGYVVAPPSEVDRRQHGWISKPGLTAIADAPAWLLDLIARAQPSN